MKANEIIKARRTDLGMTQKELAVKVVELVWNRVKFRVKMVKKHQLYGYKRINNIMVIYVYKRIM